MTVETLFAILDYAGIALFAASGGIVAARKSLDPFGAAVLGAVAGMGGGTIRDIVLGSLPVYWVASPEYLALALFSGVAGYYSTAFMENGKGVRLAALAWADAAGLSVFCVIGAQAGLAAGAHWSIALLTGVMSAAFGGLVRDIIVNEVPLVLRADIYALAALAGSGVYVALTQALAAADGTSALIAAGVCFVLRGSAIQFGWSLPSIGRVD